MDVWSKGGVKKDLDGALEVKTCLLIVAQDEL